MTDTHAATELEQYIENDADLYRGQHTSILKNLATKKARGVYKRDLAVKLYGYLVEAGAKKYANEFEPNRRVWHQMFDAPTRKRVAEELTKSFEAEYKLGNYDSLLPKKYQKPQEPWVHVEGMTSPMPASEAKKYGRVGKTKAASHHATKKVTWKAPESLKIVWSRMNSAWFALWPGRGAIKDQQVLKIAGTDEMDSWLRETYGDPYGRVGRASSRSHHAKISGQDIREFRGFLRNATDRQVQGIYEKERSAGRDEYAELAIAEAERRGIELDRYGHARKKSPAQLDREIRHAIGRR